MPQGTRQEINDFLSQKRLVMVGVSRNPKEYSRNIFKDLTDRGIEMIPVNPKIQDIDGVTCYSNIKDVPGEIDGVMVLTSATASESVVKEIKELGIKRVWIPGPGSDVTISKTAVKYCNENEMTVIAGYCPYMFIKDAQFFHRLHGGLLNLVGKGPK